MSLFTDTTNIFTHASQLFYQPGHPYVKVSKTCIKLDIHALELNPQGIKCAISVQHLVVCVRVPWRVEHVLVGCQLLGLALYKTEEDYACHFLCFSATHSIPS